MKLGNKRLLKLSICAAILLQMPVFADSTKQNNKSLGTVDVVSSSDSESTNSYKFDSMNTATRLNLSSKETPQSISVVTNEQINDMAMDNISDAVKSVVGLSSTTSDSERSSFSARGFDISNYQIDGVAVSWTGGYNTGETQQDLTIYDRVEVVRGANGLISGAGDPSAAINLVRKHANSKEFKGNITLQGGSWDKYKASLDVSTPLTKDGKVRARIAASYEDRESFEDYYKNKKTVLYGVIDADISDNTRVSLGTSYQDNNPKGSMWGGLPSKYSNGTKTNWDRSDTTAPKWSYWASKNKNYFANIEHYFENNIKLYAGYSRIDSSADLKLLYLYGNPDKTTGLGMGGSGYRGDFSRVQDNIDIYASIPFELGSLDHELLIGTMYNKQKFKAYSASKSVGSIGSFFDWDGNIQSPDFPKMNLAGDTVTKQLGTYLVGRFSLSDNLKLIAGTRLTNWEKEDRLKDFTYDHDNVVTPYAGLIYNINEDFSTYVSYTDIFKPQDNQDSSGNYLDPIEGKSYEVGIKGEFFDDKLNASFAIFRIEQDKLAQTDPSGALIPGTTTVASVAAEGTTSKGFEVELNGEITDNWNLSVGYSQFQAKDANDNEVNSNHPRKTFKLFTKYKIDKLSLAGGLNWQRQTNLNGIYQEAYSTVDLMAKYQFNKNLSAQLNIDNLFDKKYYSNVGFYSQVAYGTPRSALVTLKYSF
ncbi:TonB-dependent siderophore receptor [Malaciobacter mytili]|uniref:TonB-dependent siderophore receptor n=1 Tax=Malaciobacter mytili TaxID=603050 RepID=UPI00100BFD19|nr:TonB-dependent siderophore receptor [Malaciobacter mytili]RXI43366.1 TonB-dependent siderophore receptor [Malaciobacter mytili]